MPTAQQIKEKALSTVNGVMTALDMYPEMNNTNTNLSNNISSNPIDLLIDFFKSTKGYDALIDIVSKCIIYLPPVLETSVKAILLTNIQSILSCSIKPIITEDMIKEGVVFDMNRIDLFNIFSYSPIDHSVNNPGRYYYFGCDKNDGIDIVDKVKASEDFNAVLWYCKNNPGERVVWRRKKDRENDTGYNLSKTTVNGVTTWTKQPKSNGIVTLQYNGRSSGLTDSENNNYYTQEPMENCLHVFYGCNVPLSNNDAIREQIAQRTANINDLESILDMLKTCSKELDEYKRRMSTEFIKNNNEDGKRINELLKKVDNYNETIEKIKKAIYGVNGQTISASLNGVRTFNFTEIDRVIEIPRSLMASSLTLEGDAKVRAIASLNSPSDYPPAISNYYYRHLMMEFNYDFVMSMKLFDEKVLVAQLLDALTNCLKYSISGAIQGDLSGNVGLNVNGNINISFQQQFVEAQLREMVTRIIESDDSFISDCFFTFSNDYYNKLLQEVEMSRAGLNTNDGSQASTIPSPEIIMSQLNGLAKDASKEELKDVIKGSIYQAASCTNPHGAGEINTTLNLNTILGFDVTGGINGNLKVNINFIEQLLTKLVYSIVMIIMSPKVYVLLMANLKVVGQEPNFDLNKFIQQFSDLISSIIHNVRDLILDYIRGEILNIMQELASKLAVKLTIEQYQYYTELLTKAIECMKIHGREYDWAQDDVNYADITELSSSINQEC